MKNRAKQLGLHILTAAVLTLVLTTGAGLAAEEIATDETQRQQMAQKLSNPIASLVSFPVQINFDGDIGAADGERIVTNVQPVIPISLNEDWNVISRTILPIVSQDDVTVSASGVSSGNQSGIGDITQSVFFSPKRPTDRGLIWGAGPVILLPSASDTLLGADKWGLGPTAVALQQTGPWTRGVLVNHVWTVGGDDDRRDVETSFIQPFLSYTTKSATTYSLNTESTYDWEGESWSVPIHAGISQLFKIGGQMVQIGGHVRYWADGPDSGPEGWGARVVITMLFPAGK